MEYIEKSVAIKSAWMILEGLGFDRARNSDLERTVLAVFESAPAADVMEELSGRDANVPRWIPVTERMPESNGEILVFVKDPFATDGFCTCLYWDSNISCWVQHGEDGVDPNDVKAWMPLPEPPKEEETNV